jgi:O-antigen/teichoic acid export membrane protein
MIQRLKPKSEFSRNVLTLMTGTTIAQAIPIAISPILTRIYSPEDFGMLALFLALFSILSTIATGRYELAIMSPESDDEAKDIVFLSILVAIFVFFITTILIWLFDVEIAILLGNSEIKNWLYFIPFTVLSFGVYQSIDYWLNRQKKYRGMSENKLIQVGSVSILQLIIGVFSKSGLILGSISGWAASMFVVFNRSKIKYSDFRLKESKKALLKYKDYPLFQAPSSVLNSIAEQSPVIFISRAFLESTVGFFSLVLKTLNAPVALISKSIGQVYFQKISEHANSSPHLLLSDIYSVAFKLSILSVLLFSPIVFFGPELFSIIFGSEWIEAGLYAQILVYSIAIKFVVSPLSTIFLAIDRIKVASMWQLAYFIITLSVLVLAISFEFEKFLWIYVFSEIVMYLLYFLLIIHTTKKYIAINEL